MECCDICGDTGVVEALTTCNKCKINIEHMYCMRIVLETYDNNWRCEECLPKPPSSAASKINSPEVCKGGELREESKKLPNESRAGGKTKFISINEAIMLSSGEQKSLPSSPHQKRRKGGIGKFDGASRPKPVPLNFSSRQSLASGPLRPPAPQRLGKMEIHKKQFQQSKNLSEIRSRGSFRPSEAQKNSHCVKERPCEVQLPLTRRLVKQSSLPSPVAISGGDDHNNAIELSTFGAENMSSTFGAENMSKFRLLNPEKYSSLLVPALDAMWEGSFQIQDDHLQKEINHLVYAHPPSQVRRKVYEFSKKMPEVLHFKLVPSRPFWNSLFNEDIPDKRDIGLYFFPRVGERSEKDYIFLVDRMISTNYALRVQIADMELLVFSSKLLPDDCQCWDGKYFLWGLFHHLKRDNTALALTVQPSDDVNHGLSQVDKGEEVDMDIDMIGGVDVGRIDIPVQKEPPRIKYSDEKPTAAMALPESTLQITSNPAPAAAIALPNVKIESHDLIPPGFEEVYRLRIQNFFPPLGVVGECDVNYGQIGR